MAKSIKLDSPYYWSSRGIWHEKEILNDYLDTLSTNIKTNTSNITKINTNNLLWSGASYMHASQTIKLSEKISEQTNGIILVWSAYSNGAAENAGFTFFFVPKQFVSLQNARGINCSYSHYKFQKNISKYVYIRDDHITGSDVNIGTGTSNGITYDNKASVLRYVIGV